MVLGMCVCVCVSTQKLVRLDQIPNITYYSS